MPRYKFSWDNIPDPVVNALANGFGWVGDPRRELRSRFGVRPKTDFVEASWPILLETWLANDQNARGVIVKELSDRRLGDIALLTDPTNAECQMEYLRTPRNAGTLRTVVLAEFHVLGEPAQPFRAESGSSLTTIPADQASSDSTSESEPAASAIGLSPAALKAWVLQALAARFKHEFKPDDDGDIPISRGSSISFIRVDKENPVIEVFSPLVVDLTQNPEIFDAVNQINLQARFVKAVVVSDGSAVILSAAVPADSISIGGFMFLLDFITGAADYFDTRLVERFGGRLAGDDERSGSIDV